MQTWVRVCQHQVEKNKLAVNLFIKQNYISCSSRKMQERTAAQRCFRVCEQELWVLPGRRLAITSTMQRQHRLEQVFNWRPVVGIAQESKRDTKRASKRKVGLKQPVHRGWRRIDSSCCDRGRVGEPQRRPPLQRRCRTPAQTPAVSKPTRFARRQGNTG